MPPEHRSRHKLLLFSYIFDYVVVFVCIGAFLALDIAHPHHQEFSLSDITIQQTYIEHERVSVLAAALIAVLAPIVLITIWCIAFEGRVLCKRRLDIYGRLWELNLALLGLLLSVGLALVVTNVFKNTVGRPRPDFIARCQPIANAAELRPLYGLSNSTICTQTDVNIMKNGFKSFPSGHSSTAFSGLGFLALYLCGKLRVLDGSGQIWKIVLITIPLLAASLIAISRIMDQRHHAFDVLFGSFLGVFVAWISYRQYFPAIRHGSAAHGPRKFGVDQGLDHNRSLLATHAGPSHLRPEPSSVPSSGLGMNDIEMSRSLMKSPDELTGEVAQNHV